MGFSLTKNFAILCFFPYVPSFRYEYKFIKKSKIGLGKPEKKVLSQCAIAGPLGLTTLNGSRIFKKKFLS